MTTKEAKEFFEALEVMAAEKNLDLQCLADKVKKAITLAVKKQYHGAENILVEMDPEKAKFNVAVVKNVVEQVADPANEILLQAALAHSKRAKVGEPVEIKVDSKKIGRIAAQAAKQQIRQGLKEAEREQMLDQMGTKVGEVVNARVERVEPGTGNAIVRVEDHEVMLFRNEQLPEDDLQQGRLIKIYVVDISANDRRCTLKISRTHPNFVKRLFEREIPEIADGKIEIKAIAREPGFRSKIAVASCEENLDPVGTCIGAKGVRVNSIIQELGGEKMDIFPYSEDPAEFISAALLPAKVVEVEFMEDAQKNEQVAFVSVPDSQLSLAIGNRGQNAKLAARITGYKIDISPESGFYGEDRQSSLKEKLELRLAGKMQEQQEPLDQELDDEQGFGKEQAEDALAMEVEQMLERQSDQEDLLI